MADLMSIGLSGLSASKTALAVTGNNITNVDTAGYSRQTVVQKSGPAQFNGVGYIGSGTTVADVRRIYSEYLNTQLLSSTGLDGEAQAYLSQVSQIDALLSDSATGLGGVLNNFFASLRTAAESPTDGSARALFLSSADGLAQRFNSIHGQLDEQNRYVNTQLNAMADQVSQLAVTVANYNQAIVQAAAVGAAPNDLLDARDQALTELSGLVGVTVVADGNNLNVFLGSGQPLVIGNSASTLTAEPSVADPSRLNLMLNGNFSSIDVTSVLSGGQISGLLRYREDVLDPTLNELGRLALVIADQVNGQLEQGLDLNGDFGAALFADINDPTAMAQRSRPQPGNEGSGNLLVKIEDSSALGISDYEVSFTSETEYTIRRLPDGKVMDKDGLGFSLTLEGTVAEGDKFIISPTRNAAKDIKVTLGDPSQLAFAAPMVATSSAGNRGNGAIASIDTTLDATSAGLLPLKLAFGDDGSYSVYDVQGNGVATGRVAAGQNNRLSLNFPAQGDHAAFSIELQFSGTPAAGDSFTLAFNTTPDSDNRNALALLGLQTAPSIGNYSIGDSYSQLIETVGAKASQAALDATATASILGQAQSNWQSVSGVNLDEEAANLIKFQQYYTASAQVIKAAQGLFDTLINAI